MTAKNNKARIFIPREKISDECGVFGIYAPGEKVSEIIFYGLQALQHRGQESAGIAVSDGEDILVFKDLGLVAQVTEHFLLVDLYADLLLDGQHWHSPPSTYYRIPCLHISNTWPATTSVLTIGMAA